MSTLPTRLRSDRFGFAQIAKSGGGTGWHTPRGVEHTRPKRAAPLCLTLRRLRDNRPARGLKARRADLSRTVAVKHV